MLRSSLTVAGFFAALACGVALPAAADYREHPRAAELLQTLRSQHGFSAAELSAVRAALGDAKQLPQLIVQEQKAPERTETWTQYSKRIDAARISAGAALMRGDQAKLLEAAEFEYGVPPAVIAGVLGIETRYGRITGSVRVLAALATQGFEHPTRTPFFFSELTAFFVLCRDFGWDPRQPKGSYAGAMGAAQFMPSNYRRLALDFDGNGTRDLWTLPDAIGSIAHYFTHYKPDRRWRRGEPLAVPATLSTPTLPKGAIVNSPGYRYRVGDLVRAGFKPAVELPRDTLVGLIELPLDDGSREYWLAFPNFYSVMTYNPRIFYAMAVTQLSQRIAAAAATPVSPP
jgi:membrane-bound lytic murein transglycosylase B